MAAATERFERQMRLPEIGAAGQARIEQGELRLAPQLDELGRRVARRYAAGAGILAEAELHEDLMPDALSQFRHSTSRAVAAGAFSALGAIARALES